MNYGAIIKSAWQATWRYRAMWILGMAVLGGFGGGNFFNVAAELIPDPEASTDYDTQLMYDAVGEMIQDYWILLVLLGVCLLLLCLVAYVCHFVAIGGLYQGAAAARLGQTVRFATMCKAGLQVFWRVLGLSVLLRLILMVPLVLLGILILGLALTIVGLVLAIPLFLVALVAILPLGWISTAITNFALQAIVLEGKTIRTSLLQAWQQWRVYWKDSALIYLCAVLWKLAVGMVVFLAIGLIALPLVIFGYFAYSSQAWLAIGLLIFAGLIIILTIAFIVKGIRQSFITHLWHRLYAEIVERQLPSNQLPG